MCLPSLYLTNHTPTIFRRCKYTINVIQTILWTRSMSLRISRQSLAEVRTLIRLSFLVLPALLRDKPALQKRIDQSRWVRERVMEWAPEIKRVERVILKNARGHAFFELGLPFLDQPSYVGFSPISQLSTELRAGFEKIPSPNLWPEVGSRMMQLAACDPFHSIRWNEVQPGVYRYAVSQLGKETIVKLVAYEYLAAEVGWE